jgi:hypothetical protein
VIFEEGASKGYKPPIEAFISGFSANPLSWSTPRRFRVKTILLRYLNSDGASVQIEGGAPYSVPAESISKEMRFSVSLQVNTQ